MNGHKHSSPELLVDFCDGEHFSRFPPFCTDYSSLQIVLYYDELEVCNPLGLRRKKHKIGKVQYMYVCIIILLIVMIVGAFYFILGNLRPKLRSHLNNIQLLLLAKYNTVAEFGIDRIMEPIINDIKKLE